MPALHRPLIVAALSLVLSPVPATPAEAGRARDAAVLKNRVRSRLSRRGACETLRTGVCRTRIRVPKESLDFGSLTDRAELEFGYLQPGTETALFGPVALGDIASSESLAFDATRGTVRVRDAGQTLTLRWNRRHVRLTHRRSGVFLAPDASAGEIVADTPLYVRLGDRRLTFPMRVAGVAKETVRRCRGDDVSLLRVRLSGSTRIFESATEHVCPDDDETIRGRIAVTLAGALPAQLPVEGADSPIPLYQNADPFDVLDVTIRADFETINGAAAKGDSKSDGSVAYVDPATGEIVRLDCTVEARGGTRFVGCKWRPLKLRFADEPVGTLFEGTGTQIKIVTHCAWKPGLDQARSGIAIGTPEEDTRRLLQEFVLYEILAAVGSSALETRLIRLTFEDPSGLRLGQEFAFFREREKRAAARYGLERLEDEDGDPRLPPDPTSDFQVRFHHRFLFSHDFDPTTEHNVVRMGSPSGTEFYIPYDFDLSGVIQPTYVKNGGWSVQENGRRLVAWLLAWPDQELVRVQVAAVLQREDAMRALVSSGPLDAAGRARLMSWLDDHLRRLKCLLD